MTIAMQPIYTQTVTNPSGVYIVTFNNIPQTFTDLKLIASVRESQLNTINQLFIRFNASSAANYSRTTVYGYNNGVFSDRTTNQTEMGITFTNPGSSTASTFSNNELTIPNYTGSNFKSVIGDGVTENNGILYSAPTLGAGLWSNTSAITSLTVFYSTAIIQQHSTFTLYGITKG